VDLLGHLRQAGGNQKYPYRESYFKDEGWYAPAMLLERLFSSLSEDHDSKTNFYSGGF
jgi:hypothetical protein